jgi:saccharopine dehydrogenase (NAD+, L-lysine-forming)
MKKNIYIRNEIYNNEYRTPIVPKDILKLKRLGFLVFVESSKKRFFTDDEYKFYGAIIVYKKWYNFKNSLIIGIKELGNIEKLDNHTHVYFSHTFKKQSNSTYILNLFKKSNSILYDLEYFLYNNTRLLTFGFQAGLVGCTLGILQFYYKINRGELKNLGYWSSFSNLFNDLIIIFCSCEEIDNVKICLIGPFGNCGQGVRHLLNMLNLKYDLFDSKTKKVDLEKYDIVYNCINLKKNIGTWFDNNTPFYKNIIICDISCDYNNEFNPIKIYNNKTTWDNPVFKYNEYVDIIAIDNLPSLLPFESSNIFSNKLVHLLSCYKKDDYCFWKNSYNIFLSNIQEDLVSEVDSYP